MSDPLTPQQRHICMSHIRSKNTRPEIRLRKALFAEGYRFRLNVKNLPGKPDIVLAKYRTCIFVNGCFWHGHKGCRKFVMPETNTAFWQAKIARNHERDLRDYAFLAPLGWHALVVWECELTATALPETLGRIRQQLDTNRQAWLAEEADRRERRDAWHEAQRRRKAEVTRLTADIVRSIKERGRP